MWNRPWFKKLAKEQLHANIGTMIMTMLIYAGISVVGGMIVGFFTGAASIFDDFYFINGITVFIALVVEIVMMAALAPLMLGLYRITLDLTYGETPRPSDIFYAYRDPRLMWTAIKLMFLQAIYIFLWSLLLFIPGVVKSLAYSQSFMVLAEHPELSASDCIRESMRLTDGHKWDIFVVGLSFILWSLVTVVPVLGAVAFLLYVEPYMIITMANAYRFLVDEKNGNFVGGGDMTPVV
jgi:uncharacterized membrane protein